MNLVESSVKRLGILESSGISGWFWITLSKTLSGEPLGTSIHRDIESSDNYVDYVV